jgi:hypothetical protein
MLSEHGNSDLSHHPQGKSGGRRGKTPCGVKTDVVCGHMPGPLVDPLEGNEEGDDETEIKGRVELLGNAIGKH